jgi:hypothetical protein
MTATSNLSWVKLYFVVSKAKFLILTELVIVFLFCTNYIMPVIKKANTANLAIIVKDPPSVDL